MTTVAPRISSRPVQLVDQAIDRIGEKVALVRGLSKEIRRPVDDQWGRSESLDPDSVGDIADEGAGHRG